MQLNVFCPSRASGCRWEMTSRFTFSCFPQLVVVCGRESSCPELCLGRGTSPQTLTLFSHLGPNMTISQHAQIPLQLLLHYQSATGLNNNALSPQACNNTCWRDQQLANASINQGPGGFCLTLRMVQKYCSTPAVQIPPKSTQSNPALFVLPACIFAFFSVFILSRHHSLASSWVILMLKKQVFVVVASWDLRMRYETSIVYIRDSVRAWTRPSCVEWVSDGCVHAYVNSCLYSWALTGMLAHDNGTDVYSPLMHDSRMMTPPSQERFNFALARNETLSHIPTFLVSQVKLVWSADSFLLVLCVCFLFNHLSWGQRRVGACRQAHPWLLQGQPGTNSWNAIVLSSSEEQRGKLTGRFCRSAAVGSASAVSDHQLSALHHWLKRLPVEAEWNESTERMLQFTSPDLKSPSLCSRTPSWM